MDISYIFPPGNLARNSVENLGKFKKRVVQHWIKYFLENFLENQKIFKEGKVSLDIGGKKVFFISLKVSL